MMRQYWWKITCALLLLFTCIAGFLVKIPFLDGRMQQSVRNLFFHVPMWFGMMVLFSTSVFYAVKYLRNPNPVYDIYSLEYARTGLVFGILGIITGAIWANYQWGQPWSGDPKQNGAAIALLIYFAYFILRGSLTDLDKRSRIGAVYNIFAFAMLFPTLFILPRMTESLHPGGMGSEGNPGLNPKDTSAEMYRVFLVAVIAWTLLGVWMTTLKIRLSILAEKKINS